MKLLYKTSDIALISAPVVAKSCEIADKLVSRWRLKERTKARTISTKGHISIGVHRRTLFMPPFDIFIVQCITIIHKKTSHRNDSLSVHIE